MKKRYWIGAGIVGILALGLGFCLTWGPSGEANQKVADVDNVEPVPFDLKRHPEEKVPPGTVIGDKVPEGWTDLVLFTQPSVSEEDRKKNSNVAFYSELFKTVVLAKVIKSGNSYQLRTVASGFAVAIKGRNTIIDSKHRLGADLGLVGGVVLEANEKGVEKDVAQVVQTPTVRLIDARGMMLRGDKHEMMVLRHAIMVDPKTGKLRTFIWLLSEKDKAFTLADNDMQLLASGYREKYTLSIKHDRIGLLGPEEDAIARRKLPQGKTVAFTPALRKLADLKEFSKEQAVALENALRQAAEAAGKP